MLPENVRYAGFWVRVGAALIDSLLIMIVLVPVLAAIYGWAYFDPTKVGGAGGLLDFLLSWVAPALAVVAFWIYRQATPGKSILSLRIVDATSGDAPTPAQCVGRYLAYYVSMLPFFLGILWVAFDPRKQGWHDKLAGTVVIRTAK